MPDFENPNSPPSPEFNPYAAPAIDTAAEAMALSGSDSERIRKQYLSHEASVQSIGLLYFIGGAIGLALGIKLLFDVMNGALLLGRFSAPVAVAFIILVSLLQLAAAVGLRKLAPWVKIPAAIVAIAGLFSFNIGTIISIYVLYLIFSSKGQMVFSSEYQKIIKETPHIKYKTSKILWVLLGIVLVLVLIGVVGLIVGKS